MEEEAANESEGSGWESCCSESENGEQNGESQEMCCDDGCDCSKHIPKLQGLEEEQKQPQ